MAENYLSAILRRKEEEVKSLPPSIRFKEALTRSDFTVIAELKRKSPSKGILSKELDLIALARNYVEGGAAAISVLTDLEGFGGSLADLRAVIEACPGVPVLRKEFIIDLRQIDETARSGAHALLLIASALQERLPEFIRVAKEYGLDALVEVHNKQELNLGLAAGAEIIGINNRNLTTFVTSTNTSLDLIAHIPPSIVTVSESGIENRAAALQMKQAGFNAILVGEALVKSSDPRQLLREMRQC